MRTLAFGCRLVFSSQPMQTPALPWDFIMIALALAVLVPWRGAVRVRALLAHPEFTSAGLLSLYGSTMALQWAATALTAWRCTARGLSAARLGAALPSPAVDIGVGLAIASLLTMTQLVGFRALAQMPAGERGRVYEVAHKIMPRNVAEALGFAALVATVSVCEEFLYRGFLFSILQEIFHHSGVAAVVGSSLLFGVGHLYQGRRGIFGTSCLGIIFSLARLFTGSLVPGMMAHFTVDLIAGLAAPGGLWSAPRPETM